MGDMDATHVFTLACNFRSVMSSSSKGFLTLQSLEGALIIKTSMCYFFFNASFVCILCSIFFMHACHVVPEIPVTAITHGKKSST